MELIAGSLDIKIDEFLHAGYVSAFPRSFGEWGEYHLESATAVVIDVKEALTLKATADETNAVATEATVGVPRQTPPMPASIFNAPIHTQVTQGATLVFVFFFFTFLISLYYRRIRKVAQPGWRPWLLTGVPMLLLGTLYFGVFPRCQEYYLNSLSPPWKGVSVRQYKDPEAATQVILHGLIANALPGCPVEAQSLAAIQGEVAFPVPEDQHTPGMAYAVKTYGRDGWGREFAMKKLTGGQYRIASAGADGEHGTKDDVVLVTPAKDRDNWEQMVNGIYVRRVEGEYASFIHRVDHSLFRRANAADARRATGTNLFDMISVAGLFPDAAWRVDPHPVLARLEDHPKYAQPDKDADPLLFVQTRTGEDG